MPHRKYWHCVTSWHEKLCHLNVNLLVKIYTMAGIFEGELLSDLPADFFQDDLSLAHGQYIDPSLMAQRHSSLVSRISNGSESRRTWGLLTLLDIT